MQSVTKSIFKIPSDLSTKSQTFVIGLIDASGSMSTYWEQMTKFWNASIAQMAKIVITFSNSAKVEKKPTLSHKLSDHGGGGTNIISAFELMEKQIEEFIPEISFTIVFISDGQDTTHRNKLPDVIKKLKGARGRYINFVCLGVQSGFPTNIAMTLREVYHTGEETIPAIYLIEYASQKAFFNKFQTMKNCFSSFGKSEIEPPAKVYPWEKTLSNEFYEGTWVIFDKNVTEVQVAGSEGKKMVPVQSLKSLTIDDLTDCFRGWVQKVQLINIEMAKTKGNVKDIAQQTLDLLLEIVTRYEKENNINILSEQKNSMKTFKSRAVDFMVRNLGVRIKWYVDELTVLIKGVGTVQLSEYEAAKRIGIGTITGKYHQKALALKGITASDFALIKDEFKVIYTDVKLSNEASPQEPSVFTLQNQKQVFQEQDFLQGLDLCKTQFDLMETFPVIGYSLKVKRYDGSLVNPWKVVVTKLAKHHSTIDSMYLAKNQNKFQLNIGDGAIEEINAVLPLFTLKDREMSPLLNSRLFKLAISFMVVQNIDTYYPEAYFALLSSTYIYLLSTEKNQWRDNLIELIYESIKITYGQEPHFQNRIQSIEKDPFELFKPDAEYKEEHVDISKVLIYIFYISKEGRLNKSQVAHLADLALVHYSEKTFVEHEFRLSKFVDIETEAFKSGEVGVNMFENFKELNEVCKNQIKTGLLGDNCVKLNAKNFTKDEASDRQRVSFNHMKEFYMNITGQEIKEDDIFYYFAHYLLGKESVNYAKPVIKDQKLAQKIILGKFDFDTEFKDQNYITKHLKGVKAVYLDQFQKTHFDILPMTKAKLLKLCEERNIDPSTLKLNESSGLLSNACQSPHCSHYLKPLKSGIIQHMRLWKRKLPNQFHLMIKKEMHLGDPLKIYEKINPQLNFKRYGKSQEFVVGYIQQVLDAWKEE